MGEDETAPTAALERQVGNGIDDLLEDDAADPQLAKHPRLVAEKERRDDVVPPRVSLVSDLGVRVVCLLCCGSNDASSIASRRRALASAAGLGACGCVAGVVLFAAGVFAGVVLLVVLIVSVKEFQMVI